MIQNYPENPIFNNYQLLILIGIIKNYVYFNRLKNNCNSQIKMNAKNDLISHNNFADNNS